MFIHRYKGIYVYIIFNLYIYISIYFCFICIYIYIYKNTNISLRHARSAKFRAPTFFPRPRHTSGCRMGLMSSAIICCREASSPTAHPRQRGTWTTGDCCIAGGHQIYGEKYGKYMEIHGKHMEIYGIY